MRLAGFFAPIVGALVWSLITTPAAAEIDTVLRSWIEQNVFFLKDANGKERLLLRKDPVRAHVRIDDPYLADEASTAIANFSQAFGLPYRFTSVDVNMLVATAENIAEGNKPSVPLLKHLGFSDSDANRIANAKDVVSSDGWANGCGGYFSHDEQDWSRLIFGIALASKSRPKKSQSLCIAATIAMSFGLRVRATDLIGPQSDYLPLLLLARSMKECDTETVTDIDYSRDTFVECIFAKLKPAFDP